MFQRTMHVLLGTTFVIILGMQAAWAVSFGKVDVASKMGEPFYAEIPLHLSDTESLRRTSVEMGTSVDYRILEVYRNPVLNAIRADIIDDERGSRVTLSSDTAIDEAFFNVILKIRYGRSTHYKKIPVFLDAASLSAPEKPLSSVNSANIDPTSSAAFAPKTIKGEKPASKEAFEDVVESEDSFQSFDGWARTSRYGPMVYGDTITTVAQRLRLDDKFTNKQVMMALFEKNKAQFSRGNINLIKAGAYLDVPTAAEVNKFPPAEAKTLLSEQAKAWKAMQKKSQYAALAEAQRTRYSGRVRIGDAATGTTVKPAVKASNKASNKAGLVDEEGLSSKVLAEENVVATQKLEKKLMQKDVALRVLQTKMAELEGRLSAAEDSSKKNTGQGVADATNAAMEAQNKRLELVITRLKTQLEQATANANSTPSSATDWMLYALITLAVLVLSLLAAVLMLMKKSRQHPAEKDDAAKELATNNDADDTKLMNSDDFEMPSTPASNKTGEVDASGEMFGSDVDLEEIPDLTDEETGEMEPFNADDAPDPNVNYLEDADVYLRYGMEDEAEQQVRMALKLDPDSPEAHAKMVKVQKSKGDELAVNDALSAAKAVLVGSALVLFETAVAGETSVKEESETPSSLENSAPIDENINDSADSGIDFDFSGMGQPDKKSALEDADESVNNDSAGLEIDFDISEQPGTQEEEGLVFDNQDVASSNSVEDDHMLEADSFDFGAISLEEDAGSQLNSDIPLIPIDEDDTEGLHDFKTDKGSFELNAEEGTYTADLNDGMTSESLFFDANLALEEKKSDQAVEGLNVASIGALAGEEKDPLSLIEEKSEAVLADIDDDFELVDLNLDDVAIDSDKDDLLASVDDDLNLDDLDFELSNLDTEDTAVAIDSDKDDLSADDDLNLDDLDFELSNLDTDDAAVAIDSDKDGLLASVDDDLNLDDLDFELSNLDTEDTAVAIDSDKDDLSADDDLNLDDLDFELSNLDTDDAAVAIDSDKDGLLASADDDLNLDDLDFELSSLDTDDTAIAIDSDKDDLLASDTDDLNLDDLDFELSNLDTDDAAVAIDSDKDDLLASADDDVNLDDLDFELSNLDTDDTAVAIDSDKDNLLASADDVNLDDLDFELSSLDTDGTAIAIDSDKDDLLASADDVNLDDLDFELSNLDTDDTAVAIDSDKDDLLASDTDDLNLDDLDFELSSLDTDDTAVAIDSDKDDLLASADDVNLDDLDFELSSLDTDDAAVAIDSDKDDLLASADNVNLDDLDFELPDLGEGDRDIMVAFDEATAELYLSDLDASVVTDDASLDIAAKTEVDVDDEDLFASLDAELSELEVHEQSMMIDVSAVTYSELDDKDVLLDDLADPDKTHVLNDVAKNEALLEGINTQSPTHFSDLDAALASKANNPMLDTFEVTEDIGGIHSIDTMSQGTIGPSSELDDLMKDLDELLNEDKNKK
ncbi:MAG: FimV/HubP family polar landmark protein [Ghiorsea sp.]|nr:FimV/HubP family polar landmark protein [Ghiorsea sp.]